MKSTVFFLAAAATFVSALPVVPRAAPPSEADIRRLAPDLGAVPNQEPIGAECLGPVQPDGQKKRIPCACPPDREAFLKQLIANVNAGHAINNPTVQLSFPIGDSKQDKHDRITAGTITLQNLNGPGKGCPNVSTTFAAQSKAIDAGTDTPPPGGGAAAATTPAKATTTSSTTATPSATPATTSSASGVPSEADIRRLAPDLGAVPNQEPIGAECLGPVQPDGQKKRIPCPCPPEREAFLKQLIANVNAGHAINNPTVKLSFPIGNSKQDKHDRITAGTITLQNLNGPGKGCPNVSTTFAAQSKAIDAGTDTPPPAVAAVAATTPATATPAASSPTTGATTSSPKVEAVTPSASGVPSEADIRRLAPDLGAVPNQEPIGAECLGPVQPDGQKKRIPCPCPPEREAFLKQLIANVNAGHAINNPTVKLSFPTGNSKQDKHDRITAGTITLQNLNGPGKGCPNVATTFAAQSKAIDAGTDTPPPGEANVAEVTTTATSFTSTTTTATTTTVTTTAASSPSTKATVSSVGGTPSEADIRRLAPDLGAVPNQEPIGAECLGPVQPDGQKKRIPCPCPPEREAFLKQLIANVNAGHAINNPTVKLSFPTGDSKQDKHDRITAGTITLQNLNGPGKGCPNVSTTFAAQSKAIDAGTDTPPPGNANPAATTPPAAVAKVSSSSTASTSTSTSNNNNNNNNGALTRDLVAQLAPDLGAVPNQEPIGAECLGPVQPDGQKKRIPCQCPPTRDAFIDALFRDASLGFAANNPTVKVSFPTGNSNADKRARLTAGTIALQNLNGPGKGCPNVSTTFAAQGAALN